MSQKKLIRVVLSLVVLFVAYLLGYRGEPVVPSLPEVTSPAPTTQSRTTSGEAEIMRAFDERRSGVVVEANGRIIKSLRDDNKGSRHQLFIVRLPAGRTVLISHNIDLAPRVPLREGDDVSFRGQYEWNDRGGVVHWTHHDPKNRRPGGWIRHDGEVYR